MSRDRGDSESTAGHDPVGELGVRWPDPESGPWRVTFERVLLDGRLSVVGFKVEPVDRAHPQPIDAQHVRRLAFRSLEQRAWKREVVAARFEASVAAEFDADDEQEQAAERARSLIAASPPRGRRGRPKRPDAMVREAARIYEEHLRGGGHAPTKAVADHLFLNRSTAQKWIRDARERGYLPPLTTDGQSDSGGRQ